MQLTTDHKPDDPREATRIYTVRIMCSVLYSVLYSGTHASFLHAPEIGNPAHGAPECPLRSALPSLQPGTIHHTVSRHSSMSKE